MNPKFTHTEKEHGVAIAWREPLLTHIKTDAFTRGDSKITYAAAIDRFHLDSTVRRVGRVLSAMEFMLVADGWPPETAAGVTAYVVNAGSGEPGDGWVDQWPMKPAVARAAARARVRELALTDDD